MTTKLPTQLDIGDKVCLSESCAKEVKARQPAMPECLAETEVTFEDGTKERYCNHKNLVVVPKK